VDIYLAVKDPRKGNAEYYDLDTTPLPDIPFYLEQVKRSHSVLELGCGTGRVMIPLAAKCKGITGVDYSLNMVESCQRKMKEAKVAGTAMVGDITTLRLTSKFDLIIAPYRVMQALETDAEVTRFLETIRAHLKPGASAILNVFKPNKSKEQMGAGWVNLNEQQRWVRDMPDGTRIVHSEIYRAIDLSKMVLFPELIYRKYQGEKLLDEFVLKIKMRCYYADEFTAVIEKHGFTIQEKWGGYRGEKYGEGPELVIKFS